MSHCFRHRFLLLDVFQKVPRTCSRSQINGSPEEMYLVTPDTHSLLSHLPSAGRACVLRAHM